jgi:hypothetical protein
MSARTYTRTHPATTGGIDSRLPWWAVVLPALAFAALLLLILNPADAQAAGGDPSVSHIFERVQQALLHETP